MLEKGMTSLWRLYRASTLVVASLCGYAAGLWGMWAVTVVVYACMAWVWLAHRKQQVRPEST